MKKTIKRIGIIPQVAIFFLISMLIVGVVAFFSQRTSANLTAGAQTETVAVDVTEEVLLTVKEYPAYHWLLDYWYTHADELDIEYDVEFFEGTKTEEKCVDFSTRHPEIGLRYATEEQLTQLSAADQKLYAEITYSWMITRLNQIKRVYKIDYLFCVVTDEDFKTQFFLFSAADEDAVRGTEYLQTYPIGVLAENVNEDQQEAMRLARQNSAHLANAGDYVDYYAYMGLVDGKTALVGLTFKRADIKAAAVEQTHKETIAAIIYQIILALLCLALLAVFVLLPLRKVQQNIRLYKDTKDSATVVGNLAEVRVPNEIGELADDVRDLTAEMDDYIGKIQEITAETERIGAELSLATKIQLGMLPNVFPPFPDRREFDIYATMDPAKEVGGDFYDFFLIDDDHLCLVMADVAGKGVPAALFMMASKIILMSNAKMGKGPAQILADTNASICSNNKAEMFITVWLGILEISTGRLIAANAGHEYPVLGRADSGFEVYKDRHGFVLGGMDGVSYKEYELQLMPGDTLFLYTDGVPEATDAEGGMFGMERLQAALNEAAGESPEQAIGHVRASVDSFAGDAEQFDDLTMLCLRYKGL